MSDLEVLQKSFMDSMDSMQKQFQKEKESLEKKILELKEKNKNLKKERENDNEMFKQNLKMFMELLIEMIIYQDISEKLIYLYIIMIFKIKNKKFLIDLKHLIGLLLQEQIYKIKIIVKGMFQRKLIQIKKKKKI